MLTFVLLGAVLTIIRELGISWLPALYQSSFHSKWTEKWNFLVLSQSVRATAIRDFQDNSGMIDDRELLMYT